MPVSSLCSQAQCAPKRGHRRPERGRCWGSVQFGIQMTCNVMDVFIAMRCGLCHAHVCCCTLCHGSACVLAVDFACVCMSSCFACARPLLLAFGLASAMHARVALVCAMCCRAILAQNPAGIVSALDIGVLVTSGARRSECRHLCVAVAPPLLGIVSFIGFVLERASFVSIARSSLGCLPARRITLLFVSAGCFNQRCLPCVVAGRA